MVFLIGLTLSLHPLIQKRSNPVVDWLGKNGWFEPLLSPQCRQLHPMDEMQEMSPSPPKPQRVYSQPPSKNQLPVRTITAEPWQRMHNTGPGWLRNGCVSNHAPLKLDGDIKSTCGKEEHSTQQLDGWIINSRSVKMSLGVKSQLTHQTRE